MIEIWTRIAVEHDDFFDVMESYEDVKRAVLSGEQYLEFTSIVGYAITVRRMSIHNFYESGTEVLKAIWTKNKELDELKKQTVGWEEV